MDSAKLEFLQEELIELFSKFQKAVDDFAISRINIKRKKRIAFRGTVLGDTEWFDEYWRIERSLEYLNLAGHFEYFRRQFIGENDRDLRDLFPDWTTMPIAPGETYSGGDSSDTWTQLIPDPLYCSEHGSEGENNADNRSAFGLWCIMSGFYYRKLARFDLYDWSPDFAHLLQRMRTELGQVRIVLGFGELPSYIEFKTQELTELDESLERTIACLKQSDFHECSFERFEQCRTVDGELTISKPPYLVAFDELKPNRDYSGKIIECRIRTNQLTCDKPVPMFNKERAIFQLSLDEKCQLSFQAIVSVTLLEPICAVADLNPMGRSHLSEVVRLQRLDNEAEFLLERMNNDQCIVNPDETARESIWRQRERSWFGKLFDELNNEQGLFKQFGLNHALSLFERANTESTHTAEFILYMTTLEALFLGGSSTSAVEIVSKRYARMVADNRQDNMDYKSRLAQIFKLRNDIVHGNDPSLYDNPFPSFNPGFSVDGKTDDFRYCSVIRGICRRSIISFFLILNRLRKDGSSTETSPLFKMIVDQGMTIPGNMSQLRSCMKNVEKLQSAREFWSSLHLTLQTEVSRIGKASDIFNDKALLRGF